MMNLSRREALRLGGATFAGLAGASLLGCSATDGAVAGSSAGSVVGSSAVVANVASDITVADLPVIEDPDFGGIFLDMTIDEFNAAGFEYGDALDVTFSNGYTLESIPYYNGYYVRMGHPLVVAYPGYPHIKVCVNNGDPLWETAGVEVGDTGTVSLAVAGAFADVQDAMGAAYTNDWDDYGDDAVFANFRALSGGRMVPGSAYRSASPVDNEYNRAAYVERLMDEVGVAYDFNLSDKAGKVDEYLEQDAEEGVDVSYFVALREAGCVSELGLNANFASPEYAQTLVEGLVRMSEHEGPYLIHCVEGKDRTGFVCLLLEALTGATYDELQADYMETYANYYHISAQDDPVRYQAISDLKFEEMLGYLAGAAEGDDLRAFDYEQPARDYLTAAGMTDVQLDALVERLCAA